MMGAARGLDAVPGMGYAGRKPRRRPRTRDGVATRLSFTLL